MNPGEVTCPRCSGCGYGESETEPCVECAALIAEKRPTCWKCGGTGRVPCEVDHSHPPDEPCGIAVQRNGDVCYWCDKVIENADEGGCPDCWTPIDTIADGKAMFAELGFDTEIRGAP